MSDNVKTPEPEIQQLPVKCDSCHWQGRVADAKIVEDKAICPKCEGKLAANNLSDQLLGLLHECVNLDDINY